MKGIHRQFKLEHSPVKIISKIGSYNNRNEIQVGYHNLKIFNRKNKKRLPRIITKIMIHR